MKPVKIIMSAFGSYANRKEISFIDVQSGIFLITGDTGAGKTTIFDAITYALYDQTSGGIRDGNMMRSQYADSDVETYVELTFQYLGELYKIRRNPEYLRPAKRGGGYTTESSKVELIMPDGKAFIGKKTEINSKITDILGIDKDQFTQIAMIAQGDFLKLLHAGSDERKKIFSKIFNTKIYSKIQELLRSKEKEINIELAKNKTLCQREIANVRCIDNSIYSGEWAGLIESFEFKMDDILKCLDVICHEIKETENSFAREKEILSKSLNDINFSITSGQSINSMFDKLDKAKAALSEINSKKDEYENKQEQLDKAKKAELVRIEENKYKDRANTLELIKKRIAEINRWIADNEPNLDIFKTRLENAERLKSENEVPLSEKIARLKDTIPKYKELEAKRLEIGRIRNEGLILVKSIEGLKKDIEDKKTVQLRLLKEQDSLKNCYQVQADIRIKVSEFEQRKLDLDDLYNSILELDKLKKIYIEAHKRAEIEFNSYCLKNEQYENCYKAFLNEQAGILAKEKLLEDMPCPVCGSTHHPDIAALSENAPTQSEVELAKLQRDEAEKINNLAKEALQSSKQGYDIKLDLTNKKGQKIVDDSFVIDATSQNDVFRLLGACKNELGELIIQLNEANKNVDRFENNKILSENIEKAIADKTLKIDEDNTKYSDVRLEYEAMRAAMNEIKKQITENSQREAEIHIESLQSELSMLNKAVTDARNDFISLSEAIGNKKGQLSSEMDSERRLQEDTDIARQKYDFAIADYGFKDECSYKAACIGIEQISIIERDIDLYKKRLVEIKQAIDIYSEQTNNKQRADILRLTDEKDKHENSIQALDNRLKAIYVLGQQNMEAAINMESLFNARKELRKLYEIYNSLSSTSNGKLSNNSKIDFETYIQRQYFQKIIAAANKRLVNMSNNQFVLECRDFNDLGNRGAVGLDLDVYSLITDSKRDVRTLSGGESFMASLSMALGLADVVQSTAGAIHLDTMFIDEGFGSLDDNSREQAITVLNDLAGDNRLVGIISHVSELKEQIDNKLIVKKTSKGSTVAWSSDTILN